MLSTGNLTGEMFYDALPSDLGTDLVSAPDLNSFLEQFETDLNAFHGRFVVLQWINTCDRAALTEYSVCVSMDKFEIGGHCLVFSFSILEGRAIDFRYKGMII